MFISSAILAKEGDEVPRISQLDRCFVTGDSIISDIESRGFRLLEE